MAELPFLPRQLINLESVSNRGLRGLWRLDRRSGRDEQSRRPTSRPSAGYPVERRCRCRPGVVGQRLGFLVDFIGAKIGHHRRNQLKSDLECSDAPGPIRAAVLVIKADSSK
jgi:hypothetical protein